MSDRDDPITDFDLVAYADGKLDPTRADAVREYLDRHPDAAHRVQDYRLQNEALQSAYGPVVREPLPERLEVLLSPSDGGAAPARRLAKVAAMVLVIAATGVAGWTLGRTSRADAFGAEDFAADAAAAHSQQRVPEGASTRGDFSPLQWLTKRVALELQAPDLQDEGYRLIARQKVRLNGQPAVQLAYRDDAGRRLSVFLRKRWRESGPSIRTMARDHTTMAYWLDGPIAYGVMADRSETDLRSLAQKINGKISIEPKVVPGRIEAHDGGGANAGS